jgi:hypothetical protein
MVILTQNDVELLYCHNSFGIHGIGETYSSVPLARVDLPVNCVIRDNFDTKSS